MQPRWNLIHDFRNVVEAGEANPLTCKECDEEFITRIDTDDEPMLWCFRCNTTIHLGIDFWDQIDAAVKDYHSNYNN